MPRTPAGDDNPTRNMPWARMNFLSWPCGALALLAATASAARGVTDQQAIVRAWEASSPVRWEGERENALGCIEGTDRCSAQLDDIEIRNDDAGLTYRGRRLKAVPVSSAGETKPLPALDATHTTIARTRAGAVTAYCLDFTHEGGLGNVGRFQYWNASILVLREGRRVRAYRFDGYETGCDGWLGDGRGRFLLPVIERVDAGEPVRRRLSWYGCSIRGCERWIDERVVEWDAEGRLLRTRAGHPPYRNDAEP